MPSLQSRRRVLAGIAGFIAFGVLVTLLLAQPWQPDPAFEPPEPPDDLSNESVTEFALGYERAFLDHHLTTNRDVTDYGFGGFGPERARVVHRTAGGVYVHVQFGYWTSTGSGTGDAVSEVTYFVSESDVRRVPRGAVETYHSTYRTPAGEDALDDPVDVRVLHFGASSWSTELDLTYRIEGGVDPVWTHWGVGGPPTSAVELEDALARPGTYELHVLAGGPFHSATFVLSANRSSDVVVYVGPDSHVVVRRAAEPG